MQILMARWTEEWGVIPDSGTETEWLHLAILHVKRRVNKDKIETCESGLQKKSHCSPIGLGQR
jgi:hypothetical protein